jgi:hypothetical protein
MAGSIPVRLRYQGFRLVPGQIRRRLRDPTGPKTGAGPPGRQRPRGTSSDLAAVRCFLRASGIIGTLANTGQGATGGHGQPPVRTPGSDHRALGPSPSRQSRARPQMELTPLPEGGPRRGSETAQLKPSLGLVRRQQEQTQTARKRESSSRLWPSGVRIMAISKGWSHSPVTRPAHSPSTMARPSCSRPSSRKNAIVAGRSTTTMPTLSIR